MYSDSDWAGDRDNRCSISGYVLYLNGCPIIWKSKQQSNVAMSSSEAELYACTEAAKEIKFVEQVLRTMGIEVKMPITVYVDNVGAIFMAENPNTSPRTKHIDLRYRFITEYIEDGFIKIYFVKSEENKSDILTKNTNGETFNRLEGELVADS